MNNHNKYISLREQFTVFHYDGFSFSENEKSITVTFRFRIDDKYIFSPTITFNDVENISNSLNRSVIENMLFHIGMVEMISYWKIACPPKIVVHGVSLVSEQILWWKHLMYQGLGEFFYINNISTNKNDFVDIISDGTQQQQKASVSNLAGYLIPVGGGKDSVVTLELLKSDNAIPFAINPRKAQKDTVLAAGIDVNNLVSVHRSLDPLMLKLNGEGFLNGHTPFSALLAFITLPVALFTGKKNIALSNESSANESTVAGSHVNHQYSKSLEFENNFRDYVRKYITDDIRYFSMLRPLSEIQIGALFSKYTAHHNGFRSCNVGSKTNDWCGKCPKCMFTYTMLSAFIPTERVNEIIGTNMFADTNMIKTTEELAGLWPAKPFECVGTSEEVIIALIHIINNYNGELPVVLENMKHKLNMDTPQLNTFLNYIDTDNNLNTKELSLLQNAINAIHI